MMVWSEAISKNSLIFLPFYNEQILSDSGQHQFVMFN